MKFRNILIAATYILIVSSCSVRKNIAYFNDLTPGQSLAEAAETSEIKIRPKDELHILVNSQNPKLTNIFNLPIISQQVGFDRPTPTNQGITGYTVDSDGNIDFPVLGSMHIADLTREEAAKYIKEQLVQSGLIKDPVVTVKFLNLSFAVMGEVNQPGQYKISKDKVTILDALSMAGDLTIYGQRQNIKVMRTENGKHQIYGIDLNSGNDIFTSPAYYLRQNDVVYVEPNGTRARQSTVNGNNVRSTSFWISLASLLTSIATTVAVIIK